MTREEAIKRFETLLLHVDTDCVMGVETTEAINLAIKALAQPDIVRCQDCKFTDGERPIADGRYWCVLHSSFMYFCSDAERRDNA